MSNTLFSLAFGVGTHNRQGNWLEVFYAQPLLNPSAELVEAVAGVIGYSGGNQTIRPERAQLDRLAAALAEVEADRLAAAQAEGAVRAVLAPPAPGEAAGAGPEK
jgi:2,3,4,5-tetrahydropyridine-2-carboxylate N-succinyltransferase